MSNSSYNKQTSVGNAPMGKAKSQASGAYGAEHDSAHKDTVTGWAKAPGKTRTIPKAGFPVIKTVVVNDGVAAGGNSHYK